MSFLVMSDDDDQDGGLLKFRLLFKCCWLAFRVSLPLCLALLCSAAA